MASANPNRAPGKLTPSQARAARRIRSQRRRRMIRYASATAIGAVAIVFIIALFLPGTLIGGGQGDRTPDGPGERMANAGTGHIAPGDEHPAYTSVPATSGQHYGSPLAPVSWGVHDTALVPEEYVHNLEHGGIGIFYDCPEGCDALVAQLSEVVNRAIGNNGKVLLAPHSGTGATITLAAWTFMDQFEAFDSDRISDFVNSHESSANAPEPLAR